MRMLIFSEEIIRIFTVSNKHTITHKHVFTQIIIFWSHVKNCTKLRPD